MRPDSVPGTARTSSWATSSAVNPRLAIRRSTSPEAVNTEPSEAPQIRTALSSIASNTGCTSPGEAEIAASTSAIAVRRSSDSRSSVSSRAFSIAITAWAAKSATRSMCFWMKGRTSRR